MLESKSSALTSLAIPLRNLQLVAAPELLYRVTLDRQNFILQLIDLQERFHRMSLSATGLSMRATSPVLAAHLIRFLLAWKTRKTRMLPNQSSWPLRDCPAIRSPLLPAGNSGTATACKSFFPNSLKSFDPCALQESPLF
jgi:hypothetical protein